MDIALDQVVQQLEDAEDELLRLVEQNPRLVRQTRVLEGARYLQSAVAALKGIATRRGSDIALPQRSAAGC
ncbi:MAG: hypothetical protein AB7G13_31855 [Lautropia sp.]